MTARILCKLGIHRWHRVWEHGETWRECRRCGKLRVVSDLMIP